VSHLRCQKVRRKRYASGRERRGTLKNRTCIDKRPSIVDERSRIGDWEGDTVIGKATRGALVTLVERKSRYTLAAPGANGKQPIWWARPSLSCYARTNASCHTLTFDNGKEFAEHEFMAQCLRR
jgi:IS30 family transposase